MDTESVAAWIDERAEEHRFSGVAMVWRDGAPVFAHAAGLAHRGLGVPVHVGTRLAVASMAKMVTAATALRLVDRGVLDLHRSLIEILPREWQPVGLTPAHTLHHLLSHTSGLGNYHDDDANTWESFTSCWDRVPTYHARGPADMLPLFVDAPALAPPGAGYRYTDANFLLAGLVIEAVTGRAFSACAADEVFVPAGMTDSAFAQLDDEPCGLTVGYLVTDGPPDTWRSNIYSVPAGGMPDGGLITTATDLARLVDALEVGACSRTTGNVPPRPSWCATTTEDRGRFVGTSPKHSASTTRARSAPPSGAQSLLLEKLQGHLRDLFPTAVDGERVPAAGNLRDLGR
jgi:CubicO group peptidase (beta-lactamase class C family)